jgi:hypothetical protein
MAQRDDESLIEDMRATIRADRERAAARVARPPAQPAVAAPPPPQAVEQPKRRLRRLLGR